jgi:hypothetical protein
MGRKELSYTVDVNANYYNLMENIMESSQKTNNRISA